MPNTKFSSNASRWGLMLFLMAVTIGCGSDADGPKQHVAEADSQNKVDTIVAEARNELPVILRIADQYPLDLLHAAKADTIDPAGASNIIDQAIWLGDEVAMTDGFRILIVDSSYRRTGSIGRKGRGPNEFESVEALCRTRGDTIVVTDGASRTSIISPNGRFVRQFTLTSAHPVGRGCLQDGTIVTVKRIVGDSTVVERYDLFGTRVGHLVTHFFDLTVGGMEVLGWALEAEGMSVYWADPWHPEVREYSSDGVLRRVIRLSDKPKKRSLGRDNALAAQPRAGNPAMFTPAPPKTDYVPYFRAVRIASNGDVWLRDYSAVWQTPERWTGISKTGRSLGAVVVDSVASVERRILIRQFGPKGVLVRFELPSGQVYHQTLPFSNADSR